MGLEALALLYSASMLTLFATMAHRVYEPKSRRPDLLRATWITAVLLPLTPLTPAVLALIPPAALLAKRGERRLACLVATAALLYSVLTVVA